MTRPTKTTRSNAAASSNGRPARGRRTAAKPTSAKTAAKRTAARKTATKRTATKKAAPAKSSDDTKKKAAKPAAKNERGRLSATDIESLNTKRGLVLMLQQKKIKTKKVLRTLRYEAELERLQIELVKLQQSVHAQGRRVAIVCEGRDAAGKGGAIRRFMEHMNPRAARVVALPKPTTVEQGQWYFQRYVNSLPNPGEICFFDRSWYNRAVVEPVMGFCTKDQYRRFMRQVPEFEHMLYEDGVELIKFWFSISKEEQEARFDARRENPLKQWKISPVDELAQERWDSYTKYKQEMFSRTHTTFSPWIIVRANVKKRARLESIRYVLSRLDYDGKDKAGVSLQPDPDVVRRFHRSTKQID